MPYRNISRLSPGANLFREDVGRHQRVGCLSVMSSSTTAVNSTTTVFDFDTSVTDYFSEWPDIKTSPNNTTDGRFDVPWAGMYAVTIEGTISNPGTGGNAAVGIRKNGSTHAGMFSSLNTNNTWRWTASAFIYLDKGDYVDGWVYQNLGANKTTAFEMHVVYLGVGRPGVAT